MTLRSPKQSRQAAAANARLHASRPARRPARWATRSARNSFPKRGAPGEKPPGARFYDKVVLLMDIHKFEVNGEYVLIDVNSGSVHVLDEATYKIMDVFNGGNDPEVLAAFGPIFGEKLVAEILQELHELVAAEKLFSPSAEVPPVFTEKPVIKSLCLHIAHDCNLRCGYCFAGTGAFGHERGLMSSLVACRAVDFLLEHGGSRKYAELDFFGGEPLMNMDTVRETVAHVRRREAETGKIFKLTLTTNAVLLDEKTLDFLNRENIALVLSIDGRRKTHDNIRPFVNGTGSYDTVVSNMHRAVDSRGGSNYYARGTFTAYNVDFAADVLSLADEGFGQLSVEPVVGKDEPYELTEAHLPELFRQYDILAAEYISRRAAGKGFEFFHFNVDLEHGPCLAKRLSGCGAGNEYFAVTPEGDLYPCHQFVGRDSFKVGSVFSGIEQPEVCNRFRQTHVLTKEECRACWARFYCSGGCHANAQAFNGTISKPYRLGCELQKKRLECAIAVQVGLKRQANGYIC